MPWLTDKTLDLPREQEIGRRLTLIIADFLVLSAHNLRKSAPASQERHLRPKRFVSQSAPVAQRLTKIDV
jgi:hypothetical protein